MEIRIHQSQEELNIAFTEWMKEIISDKTSVTIALSGGSTPKSLFHYWAENQDNDIEWSKIKLFWGDERCVAPTDNESNYKMTREALLDKTPIPQENIFRIHGENEPATEKERYAKILLQEVELKNGVPSFDIIMLGMGDDGHTASIFPDNIQLWDSEELCITAVHPFSGQKRISLTGKIINNAQHVAFLVTGENKAEKVSEIINHPEDSYDKYPAARVSPDDGELLWFVDEIAVSRL